MTSAAQLRTRVLRHRIEKHLQGKHDQKSHGRGRSGGGDSGGSSSSSEYTPGTLAPLQALADATSGHAAPSQALAESALGGNKSLGDQVFELMAADPPEGLGDRDAAQALADRAVALDNYLSTTKTSESVYANERGEWSPERTQKHNELLDQIWDENAGVPSERVAIMTGGLGGSGKSSTLESFYGIDANAVEAGRGDYLVLNPDLMKEKMIDAGLADEFAKQGFQPMEVAYLIHEESSHLTKRLAERAYAAGKNVIWDVTMNPTTTKTVIDPVTGERSKATGEKKYRNAERSTFDKLGDLRKNGYKTHAFFSDIPAATSASRALHRWRTGLLNSRGGRWVPPFVIMENKRSNASRATHGGHFLSRNAEVFDQVRQSGLVDSWAHYDNMVPRGEPPIVLSSEGDWWPRE